MRFLKNLFGRTKPNTEHSVAMQKTASSTPQSSPAVPEQKTDHSPSADNMLLKRCGNISKVHYYYSSYETDAICWVSRESKENGEPVCTRAPKEQTVEYSKSEGFVAAGRKYQSIQQLCVETDETGTWCKDRYGREVFCVKERFPCFDSYDYLYEDRYFRWFFLQENGKLTRVHYTDQRNSIYVTEDVANLETKCWEKMNALDYFSGNQKSDD